MSNQVESVLFHLFHGMRNCYPSEALSWRPPQVQRLMGLFQGLHCCCAAYLDFLL